MTPGTTTPMRLPPLDGMEPTRLSAMKAAAASVRDIQHNLALSGSNVVAEVLRDAPDFYEWDHYPAGDVYDPLAIRSSIIMRTSRPRQRSCRRTWAFSHIYAPPWLST